MTPRNPLIPLPSLPLLVLASCSDQTLTGPAITDAGPDPSGIGAPAVGNVGTVAQLLIHGDLEDPQREGWWSCCDHDSYDLPYTVEHSVSPTHSLRIASATDHGTDSFVFWA